MLLFHEVHRVRGASEDAFEAHMRDRWLPELAAGDDARLLYYLHLAHGSGRAYTVVGSFIRFLMDSYSVEEVKRAYGHGRFKAAFGKDFETLVTEWEGFVDAIPLGEAELGRAFIDAGLDAVAPKLFEDRLIEAWGHRGIIARRASRARVRAARGKCHDHVRGGVLSPESR